MIEGVDIAQTDPAVLRRLRCPPNGLASRRGSNEAVPKRRDEVCTSEICGGKWCAAIPCILEI